MAELESDLLARLEGLDHCVLVERLGVSVEPAYADTQVELHCGDEIFKMRAHDLRSMLDWLADHGWHEAERHSEESLSEPGLTIRETTCHLVRRRSV